MSQNSTSVATLSPIFSTQNQANDFTHRTGARIALINIMDNAEGTERHFLRTIHAADPDAQVTLCRMACAKEDPKYFGEQTFLLSDRYADWHDVIGKHDFDLVIVTGINRGTLSYGDLNRDYRAFWDESKELFRTLRFCIRNNTIGNAALVCWSAFAGMKELYGVDKGIHPQKLYGLFPHTLERPSHPLVKGFAQGKTLVPHSRSSYMDERELRDVIESHAGDVVMNAPDGPAVWTLEEGRITCFINHLEYSIDTLSREYFRDIKKVSPDFPLPQNYDPHNFITPENCAVFEQLKDSCSHFYRNLITLAKEQKERGTDPNFLANHQNELRKFAFGA